MLPVRMLPAWRGITNSVSHILRDTQRGFLYCKIIGYYGAFFPLLFRFSVVQRNIYKNNGISLARHTGHMKNKNDFSQNNMEQTLLKTNPCTFVKYTHIHI
jgi:hypothetical protein